MFISLVEPAGLTTAHRVAELSVRALCSNRHLTEHLPVGEGGADFQLIDDVSLDVACLAGPTPPREPIVSQLKRGRRRRVDRRRHLAADQPAQPQPSRPRRARRGQNGEALRETARRCSPISPTARPSGASAASRASTAGRSCAAIRSAAGVGAARGIEITVLLDDKAFEGSRRLPARRGARPLLRRIRRDQPFHPDGDPHGRARRGHALAAARRLEAHAVSEDRYR